VRSVSSLLDEPELLEVVVVDNGSSNGSAAFLRDSLPADRIKLVPSDTNLGFGQGVNLGAQSASGSVLFILNSDAVLEPGGLKPLVELLDHDSGVAVAAPLLVSPGGTPQVDAYGDFPSLRTMVLRTNRHPRDVQRPDWVSGAAMLVRRKAFEELGGFDPEFHMYLEDVDLCQRMRTGGWTIGRVPESRVIHSSGASSDSKDRERLYHDSLKLFLRRSGAPAFEVQLVVAGQWLWSRARTAKRSL